MSDISIPESATASLTAVSACAASGISAERVTLENPTPLTATLHRFCHIWLSLPSEHAKELDQRCASFEASLCPEKPLQAAPRRGEAPQDEDILDTIKKTQCWGAPDRGCLEARKRS